MTATIKQATESGLHSKIIAKMERLAFSGATAHTTMTAGRLVAMSKNIWLEDGPPEGFSAKESFDSLNKIINPSVPLDLLNPKDPAYDVLGELRKSSKTSHIALAVSVVACILAGVSAVVSLLTFLATYNLW